MNNESNITSVNPHTKRNSRNNDWSLLLDKPSLNLSALVIGHPSMVWTCIERHRLKLGGNVFSSLPCSSVDD
jgi:hypothetical protein